MCRCIGISVVLLALASPLILEFARHNRMTQGTIPILVNEWRYKSYEDIPDLTGKVIIVTGKFPASYEYTYTDRSLLRKDCLFRSKCGFG